MPDILRPNPTYVYTFIMDTAVITNVEGWPRYCHAFDLPLETTMPKINWSGLICWLTEHKWKFNHGEPMCACCGRYATNKELEEHVNRG